MHSQIKHEESNEKQKLSDNHESSLIEIQEIENSAH